MNSILPRSLGALVASLILAGTAPGQEFNDVVQLYLKLDDEAALEAVNEYLFDRPLDPDGLELRTQCLLNLGRVEDALKTISKLGEAGTARQRAIEAECLALNGRSDEGLALLDGLLLDDPSAVVPRVKRARILLVRGNIKKAFDELNVVLREIPNHAEAILSMGMVLEAGRDFPLAQRTYMRLVMDGDKLYQVDPHYQRRAVEGLARVYRLSGAYPEAVDWYGQLVARFPKEPEYLFQLGLCQGMQSKFQDATDNVRRATEMAPDNLNYRIRLAELYYSQKLLDEAIAEFEKVASMSEDPRLSSLRLAEMYLEQENLAKALSHTELVSRLAADSAQVQELVGRVKEKLGEVDAAKAAYTKALEIDPLAFQSLFRLGVLMANSEAEAEVARGQEHLARYQRVSEFRADLDLVRAELNLNPGNRDALFQVAAILNAAKEYDLAGTWLEKAMRAGNPTPQILAFAGCIAANLGRDEDALNFFKQAQRSLGTPDPQLLGFIDKLEKGEPLPLPLGELKRNTKPADAAGADGGE